MFRELMENFFINKIVMSICDDISKLNQTLTCSISQKIPDYLYQNCLKNQLGGFDGKSSERIANRILEIFDPIN